MLSCIKMVVQLFGGRGKGVGVFEFGTFDAIGLKLDFDCCPAGLTPNSELGRDILCSSLFIKPHKLILESVQADADILLLVCVHCVSEHMHFFFNELFKIFLFLCLIVGFLINLFLSWLSLSPFNVYHLQLLTKLNCS